MLFRSIGSWHFFIIILFCVVLIGNFWSSGPLNSNYPILKKTKQNKTLLPKAHDDLGLLQGRLVQAFKHMFSIFK